jgi:single-strand DNA-binding protein
MINRVVLVGRLTKDVEVRKTQSGLSVASFTVACDRRGSKQQGTGNQPSADFISCVAWRQSADFLGQYAHKGALVGVEGRIQTRNYDRQDGTKVYVTEVVCDNVQLLESRQQSESRSQQGGYDSSFEQQDYTQQPAPQTAGGSADDGSSLDISSDDLPF